MSTVQVSRLEQVTREHISQLADVLIDCVEGGASVSFMHPLSIEKATGFWQGVADAVAKGERALIVAHQDSRIVGTVQLILAQPDNQPHRADLAKMLVHRRARRQGLGALLMHGAEQAARAAGKSLLVLDTASAEAERVYQRAGWLRCGTVPGYALLPTGGFCDTTFFYRQL